MEKLFVDLLMELECPICTSYMTPPIRQCVSGHSVCESCRRKLPVCPLCKGQFLDSKNLTLESLARKMHYPCVNQKAGCPEKLTLAERESHERECMFKMYKCAYSKCPWAGRIEDLIEHWSQKKITSRPYHQSNVCHTKMAKAEMYYVNIIQAYNEMFWYKFRSSGGKMYWSVQLIGEPNRANDFFFEIELIKPGQPLRRRLMTEYCQSIELSNDKLFTPDCSVMTTAEAISPYIGEDEVVIYYMRVKEAEATDDKADELGDGPSHGPNYKIGMPYNHANYCAGKKMTFKPPHSSGSKPKPKPKPHKK